MGKKLMIVTSTVLLWLLCLTSCGEDTTQQAKEEFAKYYTGENDIAVIYDDRIIYFEKYSIDLDEVYHKQESNNGLIIESDRFYFTTSESVGMFDYKLNVYESDLTGSEIKLIYSKGGYKTHPWVYSTENSFYVEHYTDTALNKDSVQIDKFTSASGEYVNVAAGNGCSLSDYHVEQKSEEYAVEIIRNEDADDHGKFVITDSKSGNRRVVDENYLKSTVYIESLEKFNYSAKRADISNGHILLTYSIGAGDGWNAPHLVFEYDFATNTLEYKLLAFTDESINVDVRYLN